MFPHDPCYAYFDADAWWDEINQCRREYSGSLVIRAGIELGEPHLFRKETEKLLQSYPWDYALGSLHWVEQYNVFEDSYFNNAHDDAYRRYFLELAKLAEEGEFDILAHLDVVKRRGIQNIGPFNAIDYEDEIRTVLRICADRGLAIEINTSTLRLSAGGTSPTIEILSWFLEEGGRWITFGSDAHHPENVGFGIAEAYEAGKVLGIQHPTYFASRVPSEHSLEHP